MCLAGLTGQCINNTLKRMTSEDINERPRKFIHNEPTPESLEISVQKM